MTKILVRRNKEDSSEYDVIFEVGKNLITGEKDFQKLYGSITTLEGDLLLIAASILAADRCTPRGEREDYVSRGFDISIPIVNIGRLQPLIGLIESTLRTLSHDSWRISFRQADGELEKKFSTKKSPGKTLLFSGGLDSLAAAFQFGVKNTTLQLVSHVTKNRQTSDAQKVLVGMLKQTGVDVPHRQFFVSSKNGQPSPAILHDAENSQRTRSFLFLTLGAIAARRAGHQELLMLAENGQMAIHLCLSIARVGAFSTHTAHPNVLARMEQFIQEALLVNIKLTNPYVDMTKAEVVASLVKKLPKAIPISTSCWRNTRLPASATHCGACIPCMIRRIAIEYHAKDSTAYARDAFNEEIGALPEDDEARRNLVDLTEFILQFERLPDIEIMSNWPDLYSNNINATAAIGMYRRAAKESRRVLAQYPKLNALLS